MLDPYRMIFVNIIASLFLMGIILFYKFVYPKKKINLFILLLLISILPTISILRTGTYESGDFNIHVRRGMEFFKLLKEGIFMPTWAGNFNGTYGYPLFGFNYTLPYYIISFFHFLGLSFIGSLKLFLASNFILSGIFMYIFSKNLFKNTLAAFSVAIFYLFNPYHLISIHFKIPIGEILAYTFIPLVFYFINKFLDKRQIAYLLLSGLMLGIVAISHILIAIFLAPMILFYIFLTIKKIDKTLIYFFLIALISSLISMYQWASTIIYKPYLLITSYPQDSLLSLLYSPTIAELLYSPWRFGFLFQGPKGETAYLLGYSQIIVIILIILLTLRNQINKKFKHILIFCSLGFLFTLFLISPYSKIIWLHFPPVNVLTQRLLLLIALYTSVLVGYLVLVIKKKVILIYLILCIAIWSTALNWGQRRVIPEINDSVLAKDIPYGLKWGDIHFYANSRWVDPNKQWFSEIPKNHLDILSGKATVRNIYRTSTKHIYSIDSKTDITIRENTLYFPGWTAKDNGKAIPISPDKNGVITFSLTKGEHNLSLIFEDLTYFLISKLISVFTIFSILLYALLFFLRKKITYFRKFLYSLLIN